MKSLFALPLLATVLGLWPADQPVKPLNVVFIVADDLATRLGCYGDTHARTPNLDRLAREGVRFDRAYCQGAVCTPSRTSFMLGLNTRHAKSDHFLKHPQTMTLGRWFRQHGYQTCAIGKIDHDDPEDRYVDPQAWDVRVKREDIPLQPLKHRRIDEDGGVQRAGIAFIGLADDPRQLTDWARVERARHFLDAERDSTKPFLLALGFHSPHVPWEAMRQTASRFDPKQFTIARIPADAFSWPSGSLLHEPGLEFSHEHQGELLHGYYAAVSEMDAQVGRLLDHLTERGLADSTVVVFVSDHGYHLGWRGQWAKHSLSEQVMRVPLLVRHPQAGRGGVAMGIIELIDLFPTFCEMVGLSTPNGLDGRSFLPQVLRPETVGKEAAFCEWGNGRTARDARYRLIERRDGTDELYDYANDPQETRNVINQPESGPIVRRLHELLDREFGARVIRLPESATEAPR